MPEFRLDATCGLYMKLVMAGACVAWTHTAGANSEKRWCAQTEPGGRPSHGP